MTTRKQVALLGVALLLPLGCVGRSFWQATRNHPLRASIYSSSNDKHHHQHCLLLLRGGGNGDRHSPNNDSIIQLNPNYNKPYTLGDLERDEQRQQPSYYRIEQMQSFSLGGQTSPRQQQVSLFQFVYEYAKYLQQTSPPLFVTTVSCIAVFLLWQISSLHSVLQSNFVTSRSNMKKGRWSVALLSAISHTGLLHLVFNLSSLLMLGPKVQSVLEFSYRRGVGSPWPLWQFMLGAALSSSAVFLVLERHGGMLGLSGVTTALLALYGRLFPDNVLGILVAGIFPVRMSAHQLLQLTLLWSLVGTLVAFMGRPQKIAHSAHLGGLLFGLGYYELWRRRFQPRRKLPRAW